MSPFCYIAFGYKRVARCYESAIGRFTTVDPLAEKYYSISPYVYVGNNPLRFIDPTGMASVDKERREKKKEELLYDNGGNIKKDNFFDFLYFGNNSSPTDYYSVNGSFVEHIDDGKNDDIYYSCNDVIVSSHTNMRIMGSTFGIGAGMSEFTQWNNRKYINLYEKGSFPFSYKGVTSYKSLRYFYGNQYIPRSITDVQKANFLTNINLLKSIKVTGYVLVGGSLVMDGAGVLNYYLRPTSSYYVTPNKAILNTGITAVSYWVPALGVTHAVMDNLYPGGWGGWANDMNSLSTYGDEKVIYGPKM